uniref:Uncharacterized protein n=1 Tax=Physcomitrium patens TaxID=3218 RepID=A0A2K1J216_PHYPA|nr:hypothetical protein PHYPA_023457 [Physcomitrium patens]
MPFSVPHCFVRPRNPSDNLNDKLAITILITPIQQATLRTGYLQQDYLCRDRNTDLIDTHVVENEKDRATRNGTQGSQLTKQGPVGFRRASPVSSSRFLIALLALVQSLALLLSLSLSLSLSLCRFPSLRHRFCSTYVPLSVFDSTSSAQLIFSYCVLITPIIEVLFSFRMWRIVLAPEQFEVDARRYFVHVPPWLEFTYDFYPEVMKALIGLHL